MEMLKSQLNGDVMRQLTQQIGAQSTDQTENAVNGVLTTLVTALSRNTQSPQGLESLTNALTRDHDGSLLDNISGFLSGTLSNVNPNAINGAGILGHILGNKQNQVEETVGKATGMSAAQIGSLMLKLAPLVLSVLGKNQGQSSGPSLGGLLENTVQNQRSNQSGGFGFLERLLDSDGDGSIIDDVAQIGLKTLFSNRR